MLGTVPHIGDTAMNNHRQCLCSQDTQHSEGRERQKRIIKG